MTKKKEGRKEKYSKTEKEKKRQREGGRMDIPRADEHQGDTKRRRDAKQGNKKRQREEGQCSNRRGDVKNEGKGKARR